MMLHSFLLLIVPLLFHAAVGYKAYNEPAVILVPGSFHQPLVYEKVAKLLKNAKYGVFPIDLPSNGEIIPNRGPDIKSVSEVLEAQLSRGRDVILVGNSYGATVIGDTVKDYKKDAMPSPVQSSSKSKPNARGKIKALIMLSGYIPYINEVEQPSTKPDARTVAPSFFRFDNEGRVWSDGNATLPPEVTFYNALPREEARFWAGKLQFQAYGAMNDTGRYIPYTGDFRCVYVVGLRDNSIPPAFAQTYIDQPGAKFEVVELDADHVMMLSKPKEVFDVIVKVAGK